MPLLDSYEPQGFADRGGLLGRLLSLRPDLARDQPGEDQPAQAQPVQALGQQPNNVLTSRPATSAIGSALDDFYQQTILKPGRDIAGYFNDAINDPAYFVHAISPSLGGLGPIVGQVPAGARGLMGAVGLARSATPSEADQPLGPVGSPIRDIRAANVPSAGNADIGSLSSSDGNGFGPMQGGLLPGLAAAATLAGRGSSGLLGGPPQPIAPVFPEPPVAPQIPLAPPPVAPAAPLMSQLPLEAIAAPWSTPPSSDDWQQALGSEWQQLQSFLQNTRDKGSGGGDEEPESESEKAERCRKEKIDAYQRCSETRRDYNRNMFGKTPFDMDNCIKGFLSPDCGGNDPRDPANYYPPWSARPKKGRGSRRKR
jgi:hypothetical protein